MRNEPSAWTTPWEVGRLRRLDPVETLPRSNIEAGAKLLNFANTPTPGE